MEGEMKLDIDTQIPPDGYCKPCSKYFKNLPSHECSKSHCKKEAVYLA